MSRPIRGGRGGGGGITVFRSPKAPSTDPKPSQKPDLPVPNPPCVPRPPKNAVPTPEPGVPTLTSPQPRAKPSGSKRPPPSPTVPGPNQNRDVRDTRRDTQTGMRSDLDQHGGEDDQEMMTTPKKTTASKRADDAFQDEHQTQSIGDPGARSPSSVVKKKKKKRADPEKAAQAAVYAAVNAAHAADAAAKANKLLGELKVANKEKETDDDLAEQTRAQLETLLRERAGFSSRIATLQRERDAQEELLHVQNQALDDAQQMIEALRLELQKREEVRL